MKRNTARPARCPALDFAPGPALGLQPGPAPALVFALLLMMMLMCMLGAGAAGAAEPKRAYAFLAGQHLNEEVITVTLPARAASGGQAMQEPMQVEAEFNLSGGGLGIGYQVLPQVAVEVSGSYWHGEWRGETRDTQTRNPQKPRFRDLDLTGYSAQGNVLLFPFSDADTRYNPFLKLGGGYLWLDMDLPMDWKAVYGAAGLGLEYRVSRSFSWSLQGDYHRFYESDDELESGLDDGWSVTFAFKYLL